METGLGQLTARLLLVLGAVLMGENASHGQSPDPFSHLDPSAAARVLGMLERARIAEREGRWTDAAALYQGMYIIVPVEEYRFRQALCSERAGRLTEALEIYRELTHSPRAEIAALATQRMEAAQEELAELPARLKIRTDRLGAWIEVGATKKRDIDGNGLTFEVQPGTHQIRIELDGFEPVEQRLTIGPGEEQYVLIQLRETRSRRVKLVPKAQKRSLALPLTLGGAATASAGLGVLFGVLARNKAAKERAYNRSAPGASRAEAEALLSDAKLLNTLSIIGYGLSVALLGAAAAVHFTSFPRTFQSESHAVGTSVRLAPSGYGVAFSGAF